MFLKHFAGIFLLVQLYSVTADGEPFFRYRYQYVEKTKAFYKLHKKELTWNQAKIKCAKEGSMLFHPENEDEVAAVIGLWNETNNSYKIYSGITRQNDKNERTFKTVEGVPQYGIYNKWAKGGWRKELCASFLKNGYLVEENCYNEYPFFCKKPLAYLEWDRRCDNSTHNPNGEINQRFFWRGYEYIEKIKGFYKIFTQPKNWEDAKSRCEWDGASLFYPYDEEEADTILNFWKETESFESIHVGLSLKKEFLSLDGLAISKVYNNWAPGKPDNTHGFNYCASMDDEALLHDITCTTTYLPFICEKTLTSLGWKDPCDGRQN